MQFRTLLSTTVTGDMIPISIWSHPVLRRLLPAVVLLLALTACNHDLAATPPVVLPQTSPQPGNLPAAPATLVSADPLREDQLVVWMPPISGLTTEGSAGVILDNAFVQFEQQNPGIRLDVQVKAETGPANLLNYLRSAQRAAPTILPDLVLINTQQLWQVVDLGMVQPIGEEEIAGQIVFFDVARRAVTYREQWMGVPFALDLVHLVFDPATTPAPPADWTTLLAEDHRYLFPAAETAAAGEMLLQYVGAGGRLREDGVVEDPTVLEAYFRLLAEGRAANVIPPEVVDLAGYSSVWRAYSAAPGSLAAVQVNQYYPNAGGVNAPGYAPVPTRTGTAVTLVETWAFAVLTPDAARRELALAFVNALLAPEIHGPWSQFAARLPSQEGALLLWTQSENYRAFLQDLLVGATAPPNGVAFAEFVRRLQTTRASLLRGEVSVAEAMQLMTVAE